MGGGRFDGPWKTYNSGSPRVRLTRDSPGTASVHLPVGHPNIQKYLDKGYKIVKDYKKAEQSFATPELKRKEARDQMWAKRKARWAAWKKGQVRSEDNELHLRGTNFAAEPPPVDEEVRVGNTFNDRFKRLRP